jgi:apolipoprotein N-acyltransferase
MTLASGSSMQAFLLGAVTGVVYFTGTLYWITNVMTLHGGLQWWVAVLINALLIAYLSLYPALFALVMRRIVGRFGPLAMLAAPLVWVASEMGRTYVITGFPWVLLGYSQTRILPVAQLASAFGVYGLSALVASMSAGVAAAALSRGATLRRALTIAGPLVLIGLVAVWGRGRLVRSELTTAGTVAKVGLLQGNVDQAEKWDPARAASIFDGYLAQTEEAIARGAELVVWPEASMPFLFAEDRVAADRVRAIASRSGVSIIVGSDELERGDINRLYNSAYMVAPDGSTAAVYRKLHLVPFGEYVPLQKLLFFAAPLVEQVGGFSAGTDSVLLPVKGRMLSTAICYEIVYPDLVRRFVADGSELLTTITNDAWFGRSTAPYQHFEQASMRAIENGRYLVRAANTGISGIVDPYGRVVAASQIFEPAVILGDVRFLRSRTLYTRIGDAFAYACIIATLAMVLMARRVK